MRKYPLTIFLAMLAVSSVCAGDAMRDAAKDAATSANSRAGEFDPSKLEFKRLENEEAVQRLANTGIARGKAAYEKMKRGDSEEADTGTEKPKGRLVVALSSSMPVNEVKSYMAQLDGRSEPIVVMRGFIGGATKVRPTGQWLMQTREKPQKNGYYEVESVVDPLVYRQLGIESVPAVAWLPGVTELSHCDEEDYNAAVVVYGVMSIADTLKVANKHGANIPADVIAKYKPKSWEAQ